MKFIDTFYGVILREQKRQQFLSFKIESYSSRFPILTQLPDVANVNTNGSKPARLQIKIFQFVLE